MCKLVFKFSLGLWTVFEKDNCYPFSAKSVFFVTEIIICLGGDILHIKRKPFGVQELSKSTLNISNISKFGCKDVFFDKWL